MITLSSAEKWLLAILYLPSVLGLMMGVGVLAGPVGLNDEQTELAIRAVAGVIGLIGGWVFLKSPSDITLSIAALLAFLSLIGTLVWRAGMAEELAAGPSGGVWSAVLVISSFLFMVGAVRVLFRALRAKG